MQELTDSEKLEKLAKIKGADNAKIFIEAFGRDKQFKAASETPIGVELLSDALNNLMNLTEMVISEKDTPEIRAEIRCYRKILKDWAIRINRAKKGQETLNRL